MLCYINFPCFKAGVMLTPVFLLPEDEPQTIPVIHLKIQKQIIEKLERKLIMPMSGKFKVVLKWLTCHIGSITFIGKVIFAK